MGHPAEDVLLLWPHWAGASPEKVRQRSRVVAHEDELVGPSSSLYRMGLSRGPPPPGTTSADASPGEGAIQMGQEYYCHTKCYTPGATVSVMSSSKPHQSQYLQTWSCGLVVRP